jgi:hypothetical protein
MHKFSTRNMLILVLGLAVAVVLIGVGIAHLVQLKHGLMKPPGNVSCADVSLV